jgi:hypothetical protein
MRGGSLVVHQPVGHTRHAIQRAAERFLPGRAQNEVARILQKSYRNARKMSEHSASLNRCRIEGTDAWPWRTSIEGCEAILIVSGDGTVVTVRDPRAEEAQQLVAA